MTNIFKMRKSVVNSDDPAYLYECIASMESRRLIEALSEGTKIPVLPGQDPAERLLIANASNRIADELKPIMTEAAKAAAEIVATTIPVDEPANISERTRRNLDLACEQHVRQREERNQAISRITVALRAVRYTGGANPGPHTKFRRHLYRKVAFVGAGEAVYNGVNLFIAGYAGGLSRTIGIALIVTLVNLLVGFLFGDVVARKLKRRQANWLRRFLAWLPGVGLLIIVLVNNLAMASLQAFAKEGVTALWHALINWHFISIFERIDPTAGVVGAASAVLGLIIVFMVARMWSYAESPEIDALETALAKQQQALAEDQFAFSNHAINLAEEDKRVLDELRAEAGALVTGMTQTSVEIDRDLVDCAREQHQIMQAHEGAGEMHRAAVRHALPDIQLPGYFMQKVDYSEVKIDLINRAAVREHIQQLRNSLHVLEQRVTEAKSDIERYLQKTLGLVSPVPEAAPPKRLGPDRPAIEPAE